MDALGWFGSYGFYEAADYSRSRSRFRGARCELVRSWMVHHQGMSLLSLANLLCDNVVQTLVSLRPASAGHRTAPAGEAGLPQTELN